MKNKFTKAFTLVELIVVITILVVLATIGFISMTSYSVSSRDAVRLTDLKSITKAFEFQKTKDIKLPLPDKKVDISASGSIFQHQGLLSENILAQNNVHGGGKDPQTGEYFGYAVNAAQNKFQIITFLENEENVVKNNVISETYADNSTKFIKTTGDTLGVILDENTNEVISTENGSNIDLDTNVTNYNIFFSEASFVKNIKNISFLAHKNNTLYSSCKDILDDDPSKQNNYYFININGKTELVYCNMSTNGGGRMLGVHLNTINDNISKYNSLLWGNNFTQNIHSDNDYNTPVINIKGFNEVMIEYEGTELIQSAYYNESNQLSLKENYNLDTSILNPLWQKNYTNNSVANNFFGDNLSFQVGTNGDQFRIWFNKVSRDTCNQTGGIGIQGDNYAWFGEAGYTSDINGCQENFIKGYVGTNYGGNHSIVNDSTAEVIQNPSNIYDTKYVKIFIR